MSSDSPEAPPAKRARHRKGAYVLHMKCSVMAQACQRAGLAPFRAHVRPEVYIGYGVPCPKRVLTGEDSQQMQVIGTPPRDRLTPHGLVTNCASRQLSDLMANKARLADAVAQFCKARALTPVMPYPQCAFDRGNALQASEWLAQQPSGAKFVMKPAEGFCGLDVHILEGGQALDRCKAQVDHHLRHRNKSYNFRQWVLQPYADSMLLDGRQFNIRAYVAFRPGRPSMLYRDAILKVCPSKLAHPPGQGCKAPRTREYVSNVHAGGTCRQFWDAVPAAVAPAVWRQLQHSLACLGGALAEGLDDAHHHREGGPIAALFSGIDCVVCPVSHRVLVLDVNDCPGLSTESLAERAVEPPMFTSLIHTFLPCLGCDVAPDPADWVECLVL